jgi:phage-related protein
MAQREHRSRSWSYDFFVTPEGKAPVKEFLKQQDIRMKQGLLTRLEQLIQFDGLLAELTEQQAVAPADGSGLWELRASVEERVCSVLYFTSTGRKYVPVHAFCREGTENGSIPPEELSTGEKRMAEYKAIQGNTSL